METWYFKFVSADLRHRWVVMPTVSRRGGRAEIHVLDGRDGRRWVHEYAVDRVVASADGAELRVGPNHFRSDGLSLRLMESGGALEGDLEIVGPSLGSAAGASPDAMGWRGWLGRPLRAHSITCLGGTLRGGLSVDGHRADFGGARCYVDRRWGTAGAGAFAHVQCDHFGERDASFALWLTRHTRLGRPVHRVALELTCDGERRRLTHAGGARIERLEASAEHLELEVRDSRRRVWVRADGHEASDAALLGPTAVCSRATAPLDARVRVAVWEDGARRSAVEGLQLEGLQLEGHCAALVVQGV